ncbi:MAG: tRNA (cytidine(34)-2'-O)-methyltransferase [Clostridia bacterium]|nr:tRNA (cytidine(34)-2'-O)-methyltransferase [Clostridia bacterium]
MHQLNIVLVEPEIAGNTGNISRTCAATGARLHLIKPLGFELSDKHLKRAGLDYWHLLDITVYENLDEFYAKNSGPYYYFTTKAAHVYTEPTYPETAYLVFGRETKGLPESLITQNLDTAVRLPMLDDDAARSLNLSNAVAVAAYEVLRQWDFPSLRLGGKFK